jgi:hypothetical protein
MHESVFDPWLTSFVRCVMSGFGGKVEIAPTMSAYNPNRTADSYRGCRYAGSPCPRLTPLFSMK